MEKLNLKITTEVDENAILARIKDNPIAQSVIEKLNLSDEQIKNNYEIINAYIEDNQHCFVCKSRNECKNSSKGMHYGLKIDEQGLLVNYISICPYFVDYYKKEKNLIYTTFNKESVLDDSQKSFLFDNIQLFGNRFVYQITKLLKNEQTTGAFLKLTDSKLRLKLVQSLANILLLSHKVMIIKFSDFVKEIKRDFKNYERIDYLDLAANSEVLIIDGLGNEAISSWSRDEVLLSILDNRLQNDKATILCSSYDLDELEKIYRLSANDELKVKQIIEKINIIKNS